ncbi:hypothetical protein [Lihuaxuella thermophila]|uniref:Uncharacterized protein n=1 Tax=Lihuaxuella thermophila TaxID=1173111 RepID=A0A1H8JJ10_9BACL|nr:hypothetical protein [Lihuaxuella thermophila]SEN53278.1 hypothetical protein SAMN05444955_113119 [Lihuaxuella thermophila]SEN78292.1 hypothetical protein SAMN05444955_12340 [Lihuaxuella thermophila]SEN80247.1 hypothetical protein SAMN05444955_1262 [Lihuaxuella thermophila]
MAERRMISKSISVSEKVNAMSIFARLLFTWMIPHTDDFGRMPGSPAKVKALVVPMADETKQDVENALYEMVEQNLIEWYQVDGSQYIQIVDFERHQTGLHKRTKSKFPGPDDPNAKKVSEPFREIPGNSEIYRHEENRTEENRKILQQPSAPSGDGVVVADKPPNNKELIAELVSKYRSIPGVKQHKGDYAFIGKMYNEFGYSEVYSAIDTLEAKMLIEPIDKTLAYLKGILENSRGKVLPLPQRPPKERSWNKEPVRVNQPTDEDLERQQQVEEEMRQLMLERQQRRKGAVNGD